METTAFQDKKIYMFNRGDVIFKAGDEVQFIAMVVEGEIMAQAPYGSVVLGVGDMVGISDIWSGKYGFDYVASVMTKICIYTFSGASLMRPVFGGEKKYLSVSVLSYIRFYKQQNHLQNQHQCRRNCDAIEDLLHCRQPLPPCLHNWLLSSRFHVNSIY